MVFVIAEAIKEWLIDNNASCGVFLHYAVDPGSSLCLQDGSQHEQMMQRMRAKEDALLQIEEQVCAWEAAVSSHFAC